MDESYTEWHPCVPCQNDAGLHDFFVNGGGFRWTWPRLVNRGERACRRWAIGFNRYPHNVIGFAVVVNHRQYVVNWKGSRRG